MSLRVASALALGVLLGCASQSSLMNVKHMTDENLVSYYHEVETDIVARWRLTLWPGGRSWRTARRAGE